jgi:predicted MFS family arabinose efflux permease
MAALLLAGGVFIAPMAALYYVAVNRLAPPGTATEANTWTTTAHVTGAALGAALAGILVDGPGVRATLLAIFAFASLGPALIFAARRTLAGALRD